MLSIEKDLLTDIATLSTEPQRSSPLLSAKASFRRFGSSRSGTDAPARLPLQFAPQERLFTFLSARLPGSQRDSPRPTHASAQGSRTIGKAVCKTVTGQAGHRLASCCPPGPQGRQRPGGVRALRGSYLRGPLS